MAEEFKVFSLFIRTLAKPVVTHLKQYHIKKDTPKGYLEAKLKEFFIYLGYKAYKYDFYL